MTNKRGLSTVVVTVLLILITIAAAAMVANFVIPYVKNMLTKSTECTNFNGYYKFQEVVTFNGSDYRFNCNQGQLTSFSVLAAMSSGLVDNSGSTEPPTGMIIVFSDGTESKTAEIKANETINTAEGGVRMLNSALAALKIPEPGGLQTYVYNSGDWKPNTIDVYPVLKSGRRCEKSDSINIAQCDAKINL